MKTTLVVILLSGVIVWGLVVLTRNPQAADISNAGTVEVVDGKQVIDITAKGGYAPRVTLAQADIPSVMRVKTNGTYDCSSAFTIPALGYMTNLPPTSVTEVQIPPQEAGSVLRGTCSMGMYNFEVRFE